MLLFETDSNYFIFLLLDLLIIYAGANDRRISPTLAGPPPRELHPPSEESAIKSLVSEDEITIGVGVGVGVYVGVGSGTGVGVLVGSGVLVGVGIGATTGTGVGVTVGVGGIY